MLGINLDLFSELLVSKNHVELRLSNWWVVYKLVVFAWLKIMLVTFFNLRSRTIGVRKILYSFRHSGWYFFLWPSLLSCLRWLSSLMEAFLKRWAEIKHACSFSFANESTKHSFLSLVRYDELALRRIAWLILGASLSFLPSPTIRADRHSWLSIQHQAHVAVQLRELSPQTMGLSLCLTELG